MEPYDYLRIATITLFGGGAGFMVLTNVIAFSVLRPPKKLGFLWWHVTSISLAWLMVGGSSAYVVFTNLGNPPGRITAFVLPGMALFFVAQVIIFMVERGRLASKRALTRSMELSTEAHRAG